MPASLRAQAAAVVCSLQVDQELGHAGDFIRTAPVRESMRSATSEGRRCAMWIGICRMATGDMLIPSKNMRLRVLYHGNCFDGCSSAGVFTRFYRERVAKGPVEVALPAAGTQGSAAAVLAGLLRRRRERLRRLPLLAGSAPDLVVRPPRLGVPAAGRRGPLPRRRHRPQVLRSGGEELHEVPGRHGRGEVRVRRGAAGGADRMGGDHRRRAVPRAPRWRSS